MKRIDVKKLLVRDWQLWIMLLPALAFIILFCYAPMYGIQLAFRKFDFQKGLTGGEWEGMKYFVQYFTSPMFWPTLRNTFIIAVTTIVFGFPAPIMLALLINQIKQNKLKRILQTTVYMPYFVSTVVLVAMLNILCSPTSGIISDLLKTLHIVSENTNILGSTKTFVPMYVISGIWQSCGWNSIIFLAALSSADTQLYDAAKIDGANRWQLIRYIEIPCLLPTIIILLIMNMGNILNVGFEKTFLLQNDLNIRVSEVISTYVFNIGIKSNQFSFGTAVGLFNNVVNFTCLMIVNAIAKKKTDISLV